MDAIAEQSADRKIVDAIVKKLARHGLRPRPFFYVPHDATTEDLRVVVAAEIRCTIALLRMKVPEPTTADAHNAAAALEPFAFNPAIRALANQFKMAGTQSQEPPLGCETPDKWKAASEAFYLMDTLSKERPKSTRTGTFVAIAVLLYEALTGIKGANMKRACDAVLKLRHKFGLGTQN